MSRMSKAVSEDTKRMQEWESARSAYEKDKHMDIKQGHCNPYFSTRRAGYSHEDAVQALERGE